ncbi:glycolate oxidase subunit GlcE [Microbulbifer sp. SAOS-129_SWC]|uniref:glycolate oxidase subunit GlcE n=1 Tax=Microbulbifer sp. SAOS-129_SWC TaxID=3145235 RepID=UPI00321759D0
MAAATDSGGDRSAALCEQVRAAIDSQQPLAITGGASRAGFGLQCEPARLRLHEHSGVIDYQPDELVLRVRSGTRLQPLRELLAAEGQQFAADIPAPAPHSTVGGAVACGWDGPARAFGVALRDTVLGCGLINGRGEPLTFGGQVMKNVAGYDCARLQVGALGTLGVLLETSLRLAPLAEVHESRCFEVAPPMLPQWWQRTRTLRPLVSATCYRHGQLHLRLSGRAAAVRDALQPLGGERSALEWGALRDLRDEFFHGAALACVHLPRAAQFEPPQNGHCARPAWNDVLVEWEGARVWVRDGDHRALARVAAAHGGFVQVLRGAPLPPAVTAVDWHRRIRSAFDPQGLFNRDIFALRFDRDAASAGR